MFPLGELRSGGVVIGWVGRVWQLIELSISTHDCQDSTGVVFLKGGGVGERRMCANV